MIATKFFCVLFVNYRWSAVKCVCAYSFQCLFLPFRIIKKYGMTVGMPRAYFCADWVPWKSKFVTFYVLFLMTVNHIITAEIFLNLHLSYVSWNVLCVPAWTVAFPCAIIVPVLSYLLGIWNGKGKRKPRCRK